MLQSRYAFQPYDTPLFANARKAIALPPAANNKYIVIDSCQRIEEDILHSSICPIHYDNYKCFLQIEGNCLFDVFRSRMHHSIVLNEQQIWCLLEQVIGVLIVLKRHNVVYPHMKQYAIRQLGGGEYRLIYHPTMLPCSAVCNQHYGWYHYYLAPEQLSILAHGNTPTTPHSAVVFSLAAMLLNVMNPQDCKRKIYSMREYRILSEVVKQKINHLHQHYSSKIIHIIAMCLVQDPQIRVGVEELGSIVHELRRNSPVKHIPLKSKLQKERRRANDFQYRGQNKGEQPFIHLGGEREQVGEQVRDLHEIKFDRGTFAEYQKDNQQHSDIYIEDIQQNNEGILEDYLEDYVSKNNRGNPTQKYRGKNSWSQEYSQQYEQSDDYGSVFPLTQQNCLQPLQRIILAMNRQGIWIQRNVYYGAMRKGRRHGFGLQVFPQEQYYLGYFFQDLFHGDGFYFWSDKEYFLGRFESGMKVEGILNGVFKYVGQMKGNLRHGYGECFYRGGVVYRGQWVEGRRHGRGELIQLGGGQFVGEFKEGKKNGRGVLKIAQRRIEGQWVENRLVGEIRIQYEDASYYRGGVDQQCRKKGQGEFHFSDGTHMKGEFLKDSFVNGEIVYRNGERYVGDVREMKRHGRGVYYYKDGRLKEGMWVDGNIMNEGE